MTKLFGHSVRSHVLLLYLAETVVCFLTVFALIRFGLARDLPPIGSPQGVAFASILALSAGLIAAASGLYQPDAWRRLGRFLLGCAVAAGLLFLVALAALAVIEPGLEGTAHWDALGVMLAGLFAAIMATHLTFAAAIRYGLLHHRIARLGGADGTVASAGQEETENPFVVALATSPEAAAGPRFSPEALRAGRIWAVIADDPSLVPAERRAAWREAGVRLLSTAEFEEQRTNRLDLSHLSPGWTRGLREGRLEQALRRGIDIAGSLALLLLTLPLLLLTALAIRLDSPGPVFYRQERVGKGGRVFTLYKFRSMCRDAEAAGQPRWAGPRDGRVTRVGRLIRLTRIDEIPQAINVLCGHMSLVGPRPERPAFVEQLSRAIPHYDDRAVVRPGITGWAQVNYPYGASVEDARMKLAYDLYYVKHRSLFLDLLILVATVRVVLFQEGSR
ncbi:exopolysaccharide biosynthesis polyprenyl glycosylphosphotransferase [Elioraea rosea]|uniref:exopolysaccharide biosynthesis polyprenyl glycosylphosphotransferase n=1 Tax=Elioraea rosea TaxID=2492390 RepID=UPI00118537C7|nr:exopolysaccharide biosynthesis polyprenyl glycosylphosphotransferase [Elioraea rosea]